MKTKDNPRDILRNTKTRLNKDSVAFMGNDRNLNAMINRVRSNNNDYGKAPQSLEEINLPLELTKTVNGDEDFLLYDSGKDDSKRFLIFATRSNIEKLNEVDTWFADGTFFIAPDIYQQIFTINVSFKGYNVPLVYICLVSKDESQYNSAFKVLSNYLKDHPKLIVIDFEKALINSVRKHFPNSRIGGCYFHFAKNLWANFQKKGLQQMYDKKIENSVFKTFSYLKCLAFVPVDDVIKAFTCIKELADNQLDDFMNYFENTYIGKKKNAESTKRQVPMFPIRLWNVYDRVLNDEPRTNNGIEAWHSAFNVKLFSYI
jgi:hypothetical protein